MNAMSMNNESIYWLINKSWYRLNKDKKFELTKNAPVKARISFKIWSGKRKPHKKKGYFASLK